MKKTIIIFLFSLLGIGLSANAHDFQSIYNGKTIYYNITSGAAPYEVEVTFQGESYNTFLNEYFGDIIIPEFVLYNSITYNVTSIGNYSFHSCTSLSSVALPNSIKRIGSYAFHNTSSLTSVNIPFSVIDIGNYSFFNCYSLDSIYYNAGNFNIPNNFDHLIFTNSTSLKTLVIGDSVKSYNRLLFKDKDSLETICFPRTIDSIGISTFSNCTGLTSIRNAATIPPKLKSNTFTQVNKTIPVYIPMGTLTAYQNSDWHIFFNIIEVIMSDYHDTIYAEICQGETYNLFEFNETQTGFYTQNLQTINGYDSIINLDLIVNPSPSIPNNLQIQSNNNSFEITWEGDGQEYEIYRNDEFLITVNQRNYTDTNLINAEEYCYKILSIIGDCESELSDIQCKTYTKTTDIDINNLEITLYPNPAKNNTILEIKGLERNADILLYDILGRIIRKYSYNPSQEKLNIDLTSFDKGIYYIRVVNNNTNISKKLIIQ